MHLSFPSILCGKQNQRPCPAPTSCPGSWVCAAAAPAGALPRAAGVWRTRQRRVSGPLPPTRLSFLDLRGHRGGELPGVPCRGSRKQPKRECSPPAPGTGYPLPGPSCAHSTPPFSLLPWGQPVGTGGPASGPTALTFRTEPRSRPTWLGAECGGPPSRCGRSPGCCDYVVRTGGDA